MTIRRAGEPNGKGQRRAGEPNGTPQRRAGEPNGTAPRRRQRRITPATSGHVSASELDRYAIGGAGIEADMLWAVEAHLEWCAQCRERLGDAVARRNPEAMSLLALVRANLATAVARTPRMPARRMPWWLPRRIARWAPPGLWPRLVMTLLVLAAALGLDLADGTGLLPSWCCWWRPWRRFSLWPRCGRSGSIRLTNWWWPAPGRGSIWCYGAAWRC